MNEYGIIPQLVVEFLDIIYIKLKFEENFEWINLPLTLLSSSELLVDRNSSKITAEQTTSDISNSQMLANPKMTPNYYREDARSKESATIQRRALY